MRKSAENAGSFVQKIGIKEVQIKEVPMSTCLLVTVLLLLKLHAYRTKKKITDFNVLFHFVLYLSLPTSRSASFTTERIALAASKTTATGFIFVDTFSKENVDLFHARGPITSWILMH